ncbi:tail length tape measure protein [Enterobacter hormaechei]
MAKLMQYYLQALTINGVAIPREDVIESAYIEMLNFTGPVLLLKIRDVTGAVIDNGRVTKGSELVASLGDAAGQYSLFEETFYVVEAPRMQDTVHVTAIVSQVQRLLVPAAQPRFYVQKQPAEILRELAPQLQVTADSLNKVGTWHLTMGQKPAALLKQIALDTGAMAWVARQGINFKLNTSLLNQRPSFQYEYNNTRSKLTITKMKNINADHAVTGEREYRYMGYNETEGMKITGDPSLPIRYTSEQDLGVLQNKHVTIIPKLDVECSGNPGLQAGQVITVILHRYDTVNRINESVPKNMVIERVTHFESRFAYLSKMILGIPFEGATAETGGLADRFFS